MKHYRVSLFDDFDDEPNEGSKSDFGSGLFEAPTECSDQPSGHILHTLLESKRIPIRYGRILSTAPASLDTQILARDQRITGMLIGVAVGDCLGHSTEWRFDPALRNEKFGTILDHLHIGDSRVGRISDDTQLTFWTVEQLLSRGEFQFDDLVRCFVDRQSRIVGRGKNTSASLARHQQRMQSARYTIEACAGDPNSEGRGNGGLMRFSPIVLPHLRQPTARLYLDAVLATLITHGNTWALASIVPMTHLLWCCLGLATGSAPTAEWWIDEYLRVGADLELGPLPYPLDTDPIPALFKNFRGTLCDFLDGPVRSAYRKGVSLRDACSLNGFGSRADILQTVPAVLYTLMCHSDDVTCSLLAAVNDTKDNDTIAAIVGAYVGALHGREKIRAKWIDGIASTSLHCRGYESESDRRVIEKLAAAAQEKFC